MRPLTEAMFGDILRRLRSAAGMTQEELAERARLSTRAVSDLERGINRYPYRSTVQSLVDALDASSERADELFTAARRPSRSPSAPELERRMLPIPPTAILGREDELSVVLHLIRWDGVRFLTLTGPGGVGKTRMAEEVGKLLEQEFSDGAVFVSLASLADAALVPSTLATILDVRPSGSQGVDDALLVALRDRELFVVLDNFEHILSGGPIVSRLLAGCPKLKILVTSREPLRLRGEHEVSVTPLAIPGLQHSVSMAELLRFPSVALFVDRARAIRADFEVSLANASAVAEICRKLDGLPLALELAATQLKHRSVEWLANQMAHRLDVLGPGARDLPPRQQTMMAAIEWSYNLLDSAEQAIFSSLSVFAGGGELEGVEMVAGAVGVTGSVASLLDALADKSLIRLEIDRPWPRFYMLETVREFAAGRLEATGSPSLVKAAHAAYHLNLAEETFPRLNDELGDSLLSRQQVEIDNLRLALQRYQLLSDGGRGRQLAGALWRLWLTMGAFEEGRRWLEEFLELPEAERDERLPRARALHGAGVLAYQQGDLSEAESHVLEAESLFRAISDERGLGDALNALAIFSTNAHRYRRAEEYLKEALALARRVGGPFALGRALNNLASVDHYQGRLLEAVSLYEQALDSYQSIGDPMAAITTTLSGLSQVLYLLGRYEEAKAAALKSIETARTSHSWYTAEALDVLGRVAFAERDHETAEARYRDCVSQYQRVQTPGEAALGFIHLADLFRTNGDYSEARSWADRGMNLKEGIDGNRLISVHGHLCLGDIDRDLSNRKDASAHYRISLQVALELEYVVGVVEVLEHIGWHSHSINPDLAVTALSSADRMREASGMVLTAADQQFHDRALEELHEGIDEESFIAIWNFAQSMDWQNAASSVLNELLELAGDVNEALAR